MYILDEDTRTNRKKERGIDEADNIKIVIDGLKEEENRKKKKDRNR